MANINSNVVVFEHGGSIEIGPDTVLMVEKGTLEWEPGMWETKEFTDRGAIQDPLQGDELPTTLRFSVKYTSTVAAGELDQLLTSQANPFAGKRRQFSIVVKYPPFKGATAAIKTVTFGKCVCTSVRVRAGADFDTLEAEFRHQGPAPTITSTP